MCQFYGVNKQISTFYQGVFKDVAIEKSTFLQNALKDVL